MKPVTWYKGTTGLNNSVDSVRLTTDFEKGIVELSEAVNIDVDDTGRISRVKGYTQLLSYDSHSLWSDGVEAFCVCGTSLYRLQWNGGVLERVGLRSGLTAGARMSFVKGGGRVYYSNGVENGYIEGNTSYAWVGQAYVGHETVYQVSTVPPVGNLLELHNGFLLIVEGANIWWSMPFAYSWFRLSKDRVQFRGNITMCRSLEEGVWVSDPYGVYYLKGRDPGAWERTQMSDDPAVLGTDCRVNGYDLPDTGGLFATANSPHVIWTGKGGVYTGTPDGSIKCSTEGKLVLPDLLTGAAAVFNGKYVCSITV